jgi:hypothetical protein
MGTLYIEKTRRMADISVWYVFGAKRSRKWSRVVWLYYLGCIPTYS